MGGGWPDSRPRVVRGQAINPAALRHARLNAGLTLAQTATGIVSRQALHQFETGKARPAPATLEAIARRLGIPPDALLVHPTDPRELQMRQLDERQQWRNLKRVAGSVLADPTVTGRMQALTSFYYARAMLDQAPDEAITHLRRVRPQLV